MYRFKNKNLQEACFNHPSAKANIQFQRLEFLGDKILGCILSQIIFDKFPNSKEGDLTIILSSMVNQKKLYEKGQFLRKYLKISCPINYSSLSDCFEAWIAAVYLDGGDINNILANMFEKELNEEHIINISHKNQLQEITQKYHINPEYEYTTNENNEFVCKITANNRKAFGVGLSKKESSQKAAKAWIRKFANTNFYEKCDTSTDKIL